MSGGSALSSGISQDEPPSSPNNDASSEIIFSLIITSRTLEGETSIHAAIISTSSRVKFSSPNHRLRSAIFFGQIDLTHRKADHPHATRKAFSNFHTDPPHGVGYELHILRPIKTLGGL